MGREARLVGIGHALAHHLEQREIFLRHRVADGVGDIDGGGAGIDRGFHAAAEEIVLGAGAVLGRPFHVVGVAARAGDLPDHHLIDLVRLLLQLPLHVHRRGGQESMDAPPLGRPDRLRAAVDILRRCAREPADHGILGAFGNLVDGGEVAFRGDRETGLDNVHAHSVEQFGDLELLFMGHGRAGTLLAVAQRRVEDDDTVLVGLGLGSHGLDPSRRMRRSGRVSGVLIPLIPRVPRHKKPSRRSGADKEKESAQNEGGRGFGLSGRPLDRARFVARRHGSQIPSSSTVKLADSGKARVNRR